MSVKTPEEPASLLPEHLDYLTNLRDLGDTNMWGADTFLRTAFPSLSQRESRDILFYWMDTCAYV